MEEKKSDAKRKISPSIPANYISILQLQERWTMEKERKQKEEEERRRKQPRTEEDLKKSEKRWDWKKKESIDGGEERCAGKEEVAAIGSERSEDEGLPKKKKKNRGAWRKRYRKKKNQDVGVEDHVVPPENNTPVKDEIRVYGEKQEIAKGNGPRAVTESTPIETQFQSLSIKNNPKARTRSSHRNRINDLAPMVWVKKS